MRRAFSRARWLLLGVLPALLGLVDCRGATQLTLEITTDVVCVDGDQVDSGAASAVQTSIIIGHTGQLESTAANGDLTLKSPTTVTSRCKDGRIGQLVVVPSGGKDEEVAIMVVSGLNTPSETCAQNRKSCIFARRSLRYLPHADVPLSIVMHRSCLGQVCDPSSTCVNNGCVPARCPPDTPCTDSTLGVFDAGVDPPREGGGSDAPLETGGPDAFTPEAGTDSGADAGDSGDGGGGSTIGAIAAGGHFTCALIQPAGTVKCWGDDTYGQLGNGKAGSTSSSPTPQNAIGISGVDMLAGGGRHICARSQNGSPNTHCWGDNSAKQFLPGGGVSYSTPTPAFATDGSFALGVWSTCWHDSTTNKPTCRGSAPGVDFGNFGGSGGTIPAAAPISVGECHLCWQEGVVPQCWGTSNLGRLGDTRNTTGAPSPGSPVWGSSITLVQLASGWHHTCAVDSLNAVTCWGAFADQDCVTTTNAADPLWTLSPTKVTLPPATQVVAGTLHACALTSAGNVMCWGENNDKGQLGPNAPGGVGFTAPVVVPLSGGGGKAVQIAAGFSHTCALMIDRKSVYCWGNNLRYGDDQPGGQIGAPLNTPFTPTPTLVKGL